MLPSEGWYKIIYDVSFSIIISRLRIKKSSGSVRGWMGVEEIEGKEGVLEGVMRGG